MKDEKEIRRALETLQSAERGFESPDAGWFFADGAVNALKFVLGMETDFGKMLADLRRIDAADRN